MLFFMASAMFTVMSCSKDDNNNTTTSIDGGTTPTPTPPPVVQHGRLYGTSWALNYIYFDYVSEMEAYRMKCTATLYFETDNTGKRVLKTDRYNVDGTTLIRNEPDTIKAFTYVYNGGDSQYGPGVLYWENGDSTKFNVCNFGDGDQIYTEEDDFPDPFILPQYNLNR
jgi:hypothetical protein